MKQLMIFVAVVCAATMSPAANFLWKTAKTGGAVNGPEGKALVSSTAYIFASSAAESILAAWADNDVSTDWTVGALDSSAFSADGKISTTGKTAFNYGTPGEAAYLDAIFAVEQTFGDTKYLYISTVAGDTGPGTGSKALNFTEGGVSTAIRDPGTYTGAGWYAAAPEPTSGLLLLLGMAGLALRRRRA